jgi:hypothetical protein
MSKPKPFTACVFDIETTALEAVGAGMVLVAVVKPMGDPRCRVFRIDRSGDVFGHEVNLLTKLFAELEKYELIIGHNADRFDFPFLRTRAELLGITFTHRPLIYDTMKGFNRTGFRTVLTKVGKPTAALDMVIDLFGYKQKKTKLYPRHHWETIWGSVSDRSSAMTDLIDHCVKDVEMTEEIFWKIFKADPGIIIRRVK